MYCEKKYPTLPAFTNASAAHPGTVSICSGWDITSHRAGLSGNALKQTGSVHVCGLTVAPGAPTNRSCRRPISVDEPIHREVTERTGAPGWST